MEEGLHNVYTRSVISPPPPAMYLPSWQTAPNGQLKTGMKQVGEQYPSTGAAQNCGSADRVWNRQLFGVDDLIIKKNIDIDDAFTHLISRTLPMRRSMACILSSNSKERGGCLPAK